MNKYFLLSTYFSENMLQVTKCYVLLHNTKYNKI